MLVATGRRGASRFRWSCRIFASGRYWRMGLSMGHDITNSLPSKLLENYEMVAYGVSSFSGAPHHLPMVRFETLHPVAR